ncbi:MAG: hypothetical protein ABH849_00935 [Nanoarchaeota archaeon]
MKVELNEVKFSADARANCRRNLAGLMTMGDVLSLSERAESRGIEIKYDIHVEECTNASTGNLVHSTDVSYIVVQPGSGQPLARGQKIFRGEKSNQVEEARAYVKQMKDFFEERF